jgi:membrane protease YdiL (CAAX protease family)
VPGQPAHWGFWGTVLWGALILLLFIVLQLAAIIAVASAGGGALDLEEVFKSSEQNGRMISIATFVTTVFGCGLIAGIVKLKKNSVLADYLGIKPVASEALLRWIWVVVAYSALTDSLTVLLGRPVVPPFMAAVYASADPVWLLWAALIVAAPLFEETFFRGFLFKGLESSALGPVGAVLATSALWTVIHLQYDFYEMGIVFGLGLLLGFARVRSGSLLVPLAMHAMCNTIATLEAAVLG